MKNPEWLIYSYRHRKAFEYCVRKWIQDPALREEMLRRAESHDMDKMIMYLFMEQEKAQMIHVQTKPHHLENNLPKTHEDLVEAVIDYECAPYTKPDKPLNAYAFVRKLMEWKILEPAMGEKLISIMEELGIAYETTFSEDLEGQEYMKSLENVTEEMVLKEILCYINDHPGDELRQILGR